MCYFDVKITKNNKMFAYICMGMGQMSDLEF